MFALQAGGWCASSSEAGDTYNVYGPSNGCLGSGLGGGMANRVYQIKTCSSELLAWQILRHMIHHMSLNIVSYHGKIILFILVLRGHRMSRMYLVLTLSSQPAR